MVARLEGETWECGLRSGGGVVRRRQWVWPMVATVGRERAMGKTEGVRETRGGESGAVAKRRPARGSSDEGRAVGVASWGVWVGEKARQRERRETEGGMACGGSGVVVR